MRLIDADKLRQRLNPDDWGTPDEQWRPEREFGELIDYAPTVDLWHYPSKGEYPLENVLVLMKIPGCYVLGWYDDGNWFLDDGEITVLKCAVSHWQYIIPPKEEA